MCFRDSGQMPEQGDPRVRYRGPPQRCLPRDDDEQPLTYHRKSEKTRVLLGALVLQQLTLKQMKDLIEKPNNKFPAIRWQGIYQQMMTYYAEENGRHGVPPTLAALQDTGRRWVRKLLENGDVHDDSP